MYRKSEELKLLEALIHQDKAKRHPAMPSNYVPKTAYRDDDANGLTNAIIDYIDLIGGWATRISVEGRYIEKLGRRIPSSVKKGTADIHAVYRGRHLSIEVKVGKDRQSEHQIEVQQDIESAGGLYFIARDFASFYQWFNTVMAVAV